MKALVDVSLILSDPDLVSDFKVLRRPETISKVGRSSVVPTIYPTIGVVLPISPNNLDRHDGYQTTQRAIEIYTRFRIQGEVTGYQPDIIQWRGDQYVVKAVDYFNHFGLGYVHVEAVSMDKTDVAITERLPGAMNFKSAVNSSLTAIRKVR